MTKLLNEKEIKIIAKMIVGHWTAPSLCLLYNVITDEFDLVHEVNLIHYDKQETVVIYDDVCNPVVYGVSERKPTSALMIEYLQRYRGGIQMQFNNMIKEFKDSL